jgi:RHS repeat-associated protein
MLTHRSTARLCNVKPMHISKRSRFPRFFITAVAIALLAVVSPTRAAERVVEPMASFNYAGIIFFPTLGELVSNFNAKEAAEFEICTNKPTYSCSRSTVANVEPYGSSLTNGLPGNYYLFLEHYWQTRNAEGTVTSGTGSGGVLAHVHQNCPAGYTSQYSGPTSDRTMVCEKRETLSCENPKDNVGNPINIATGCKTEREVDYATADGFLRVERRYLDQYNGWALDTLPRLLEIPATSSVFPEGLWVGGAKLNCPDMIVKVWPRYKATTEDPDGIEEYYHYYCPKLINNTSAREVHLWLRGRHYRFTGSGSPLSADGLGAFYLKLYELNPPHTTGAVWKLVEKSGDVSYFYANGTLARTEFASGGHIDYSFNGARLSGKTDHKGRTLIYQYDTHDRLVSIGLPTGGSVTYDYGADETTIDHSLLKKVTWPDGGFVEYLYNESEHISGSGAGKLSLTGKLDAEGRRIGTYKYASTGKAVSTEGALGTNKKTLQYLTNTNITDALGTVRTYSYSNSLSDGIRRLTQITQPAGSGSASGSSIIQYETNGLVKERRDFNVNKTQYVHDMTRGLETVRVEGIPSTNSTNYRNPGVTLPAGVFKTSTEWHSQWNEPTRIAAPGKRTTYIYDGDTDPFDGNQVADCSPATLPEAQLCRLVEQATTDTNGAPGFNATLDTNLVARQRLYTYNSGQLLTETRLPGNTVVQTREYYETNTADWKIGDLKSIANALDQETTFEEYNISGYPLRITDPNGVEILLTYDARDRLLSHSINGAVTSYGYDIHGNLITVQTTDGTVLNYEYDAARRLVAIEDATGGRVEYEYDLESNLRFERIKDPGGVLTYTREQVYDALSRLMRVVDASSVQDLHTYDKNGNKTGITDPNNYTTTHSYDTLNRLIKTVDPENGSTKPTEYSYDTRGNLTQVKDPRGLITQYQYNGFHEVTQQTSPDTGTTTYTYDAAGNRSSQTDAKGVTVNYSYDALDRLTLVNAPGTADDISYTYDTCTHGVGRLCGITRDNVALSYAYDAYGNLAGVEQTIGSSSVDIAYTYDEDNRLESVTYPSGVSILYGYDSAGRIASLTLNDGAGNTTLIDNVRYQPMGPVKGYDPANGVDLEIAYNLDGRVESIQAPPALDRDYDYDLVGNIHLIDEAILAALDRSYYYDAINRLSLEQDLAGTTTLFDYAYDPVGNRTLYDDTVTSQSLTYGTTSNRLTAIDSQSVTTDNNGNITSIHGMTLSYDAHNRLSSATVSSIVTNYAYNGLGERVTKTTGSNTRHYFYSGPSLLAEYAANGDIEREYIYLNGQPVVMLDHTGSGIDIYWIHNDHLGRPLALTDNSGDVVWKLVNADAFGNAASIDEDPDNNSVNLTFNMRFPGQYFDQETGLSYNMERYFDSEVGRYITADSVGVNEHVANMLMRLQMMKKSVNLATPPEIGDPTAFDPRGMIELSQMSGLFSVPLELNSYAYVANNPLRWIDPTGESISDGFGFGSSSTSNALQCEDDDKKKKNCAALRDNIINQTCKSITNPKKKMRCFAAAWATYLACLAQD